MTNRKNIIFSDLEMFTIISHENIPETHSMVNAAKENNKIYQRRLSIDNTPERKISENPSRAGVLPHVVGKTGITNAQRKIATISMEFQFKTVL
jgi:hypothetical protein